MADHATNVERIAADMEKAVNKDSKTVAIVLAGLYVLFGAFLFWRFGWDNWDRAVGIFNAFSAIGAAAFGVLLGTKVQQVNVVAAKKEVVEAKVGEDEAKRRAAAAMDQEEETAGKAKVLRDLSEKLLGKRAGKALGVDVFSILPKDLSDPDDEKLRQAIIGMDEVLKRRSSFGY